MITAFIGKLHCHLWHVHCALQSVDCHTAIGGGWGDIVLPLIGQYLVMEVRVLEAASGHSCDSLFIMPHCPMSVQCP